MLLWCYAFMMFFRTLYWTKILIASSQSIVHIGEYCKKKVYNTFFDQIQQYATGKWQINFFHDFPLKCSTK